MTQSSLRAAIVAFGVLFVGLAGRPAHAARFRAEPHISPGAADWVVRGAGHMVFGSDRRVVIDKRGTLELENRVASAALVGSRLFLADDGGALFAIELAGQDVRPSAVSLKPPLRGALHLAALDGALVIAEDGVGIHVFPVGGVCHAVQHRSSDFRLAARTGFLPFKARFAALEARDRTIRAAVPGEGILEIDAHDLSAPRLTRCFAGPGDALALADDGVRLYALGPRGLSIWSLDDASAPPQEHPDVRGTGLSLAGRRVWVAGGADGVVPWIDTSSAPLLVEVSVNNNFYSPDELTVNVGDTVRWTNVTGDQHNVYSCTTDQLGCDGIASQEKFTSGPASAFFVEQFTFTQPGSNPYVCQPHATFMTGRVEVQGTVAGPPAVPDAMSVTRLSADASVLAIHWDTTSCSGAADHQLLYGYASQLPSSPGGTYGLGGGVCAIGTDSPVTWADVPPVTPGGTSWLWWIVVATDGAATEGAWGPDGAGAERDGSAGSGSSGQCGVTAKDLSSTCGR